MVVVCTGCEKEPEGETFSLLCPKCKRFGKDSYFCGNDCFKDKWVTHKQEHVRLFQEASGEHSVLKQTIPFSGGRKERLPARMLELEYAMKDSKSWGKETMKLFKQDDEATWKTDPFLSQFLGYNFSGKLRPYPLTRQNTVPPSIKKPDYGMSPIGEPVSEQRASLNPKYIQLCDKETIANLREAGIIGRRSLDLCNTLAKVGVTTDYINQKVHDFIVSNGAYPSPLRYYNYPKSLCTSVNEVICHGIPDLRPLQDGDILNCDITVFYKGVHADLNETYIIGTVTERAKRIVSGAYACIKAAMEHLKPGMMYREIGNHIHNKADALGLQITRSYCGHGINALFHCAPNVPHYRKNKAHGVLTPGHVFTIEPMINESTHRDLLWPDGWTAVTADGGWSAQFEHTFLVTSEGIEVLTARLPDSPPLQIDTEEIDLCV